MIIHPLTEENINHVFSCLWERGKNHCKMAPYIGMIGKPWTFAFYDKEECCAVGFLEPIGDMTWRTHFAATEEGFARIWLPLTRFMRRLSDKLANDGCALESVTPMNSKVGAWFFAMGFTESVDKYLKSGRIKPAIGHGAEIKRGVLCVDQPNK